MDDSLSDFSRYLEDASGFQGHADAAFAPKSEEEAVDILRRAHEKRIPVTLSGAGTGLTGGRVAQGGWVLSLEYLSRITVKTGSAVVGPGALLSHVQAAATQSGQFYPPDPTEWLASIGGSIATNASGSRSFLYGATVRHLLRIRAVLTDGTILNVARGEPIDFDVPSIPLPRTRKHSAGYPLRPRMSWIELLAGSEGTLAAVLEAEVRLLPIPRTLLAGVVFFRDEDLLLAAVDSWRGCPGIRMLEYMDYRSLLLLEDRYPEIPREARGALLVEQEMESGEDKELDAWIERLETSGALAQESWFGVEARDRERFRTFRHALPETVNERVRRNGFLKVGSDYAVPLDQSRPMLAYYRSRLDRLFPERYAIFGHIGDAHLHVNVLPESAEQFSLASGLMVEFAREAVRLGGSVAAEHGLGKRKRHLLAVQYQPEHIEAMKQVKRRLDPHWLLGQGNLFEAGGGSG